MDERIVDADGCRSDYWDYAWVEVAEINNRGFFKGIDAVIVKRVVEVVDGKASGRIRGSHPLSARVKFNDFGHSRAFNSIEIFQVAEMGYFHKSFSSDEEEWEKRMAFYRVELIMI